jgi:hypothetical protein
MSEPRWEDFEIEYVSPNRFQYLGTGMTEIEEKGGDRAWYLAQPGAA